MEGGTGGGGGAYACVWKVVCVSVCGVCVCGVCVRVWCGVCVCVCVKRENIIIAWFM